MKLRVISCLATLIADFRHDPLGQIKPVLIHVCGITLRAPQCPATMAAMMPIGPAPVMITSSPTILNTAPCAQHCRTGQKY